MRVFKKIMYIVLAFVPILPILLFAVCNVGNASGVDIVPFGEFSMYLSEDDSTGDRTCFLYVEKDTLIDYFTQGLIPVNTDITKTEVIIGDVVTRAYVCSGDNMSNRFILRIADLYDMFDSFGFTPPLYVVFVFAYLCYMLFIHVAFMLFDIITFVPRKISDMLEV